MKELKHFILPEQTNELYEKEAISSISLTRDIAEKVNELVDACNELSETNLSKVQEQDGTIRKAVLFMKDNLMNSLNDLLELKGNSLIDTRVKYHINHLQERLDTLLGSVSEGSTSGDAELIDIRTGADGVKYNSAGESVRKQIDNLLNELNSTIESFENLLNKRVKKSYSLRPLKEFIYPEGFSGTFKPFELFTDGIVWRTNFNPELFKNKDSNVIYYVAPEGTWTNSGILPSSPIGFYQAYSRAKDGDTIIMLPGEYRRDNLENSDIPLFNKSLNIIAMDGAVWINGQLIKPTFDDATKLYKAPFQRNAKRLFDWDINIEYKKVDSIQECQNTPNSFYTSDNGFYVSNLPKTRFITLVTIDSFRLTASGTDKNYYLENLTVFGGNSPVHTSDDGTAKVSATMVNCEFAYNCSGQANGEPIVAIRGGNVILANCLVHDSQYDGISYVSGCEFVELNCRCYNNGTVNDYSNGSTGHAGAKGIRINSVYFNNRGGNVADVQEGTQTINLGCIAYDSSAVDKGYNQGFGIQQPGTTMWLYNCIAFDNFYDFYAVPETNLICEKCVHSTDNFVYDYSGNLTDSDSKVLDYYLMRNFENIMQQLS